MSLWSDFLTNDEKIIHKWAHYFPIYERHFSRWQNRSLVFWEVGVSGGGSLQMWQRFFGPNALVVGIDINPHCQVHEASGIKVRIGDQSDGIFLDSIVEELGAPDILLDDGSHEMDHTWDLFRHMYPKIPKNGIYMVEDMHTSYWPRYGGGLTEPGSFINRSKALIDELNADHTQGVVPPTDFTRTTDSISFYDSIVVFEKGNIFRKRAFRTGTGERPPKPPKQSKAAAPSEA